MRIAAVKWENYRRLPDGELAVRRHLVLVGANDTGKSSVLRAIHLCLGLSHSQLMPAVSARDFTDADKPLRLTVTLDSIEEDDKAAFPDEITVGPPDVLVVTVEASLDSTDPDTRTVRRFFPDGGHERAPTRNQMAAIGFQFVPAVRSLLRELGGASGGAMRSLLSGLDLGADEGSIAGAAATYRSALDSAAALMDFRKELADALSSALPHPVPEGDVRVVSESELLEDPLSGVTITVKDGEHDAPLSDQSDGIRALSAMALLGMSHKDARIIAIDEPETHLQPAAQRSLVRSMRDGSGQRVLATHSPAVVAAMEPMDIVAFRADRSVRQLPSGAGIATTDMTIRHWTHRLIEPLTSHVVMLVEGPSDQILVERVADVTGVNLDRHGVGLFNLDGADLFSKAYEIYGPAGFDLPLVGMVDEDRRQKWADTIGVPAADLDRPGQGYVVCDPDLEAEYIAALGVPLVAGVLAAAPALGTASLLASTGAATIAALTDAQLARYCRRHKVPAALAVAQSLTAAQAATLTPIVSLLALAI